MTLDSDVEQIIRRLMAERGVSFRQALNEAVRMGAQASKPQPFRTQTARLGECTVNLDRALTIAGDVEDEELLRRMRLGS